LGVLSSLYIPAAAVAEFASIVHLLHHNFHIFPYPYHTTLFPFVHLLFFKQALEEKQIFFSYQISISNFPISAYFCDTER